MRQLLPLSFALVTLATVACTHSSHDTDTSTHTAEPNEISTRVAPGGETKVTAADLDRDLADLNDLGIPRATWPTEQMDRFETLLNKVEVTAKQLGDPKTEVHVAEMRAALGDERLNAVRERQGNELYQQTLNIARGASEKCMKLAVKADQIESAREHLTAMTIAGDCTKDAVNAIGDAMTLAHLHGDDRRVQIYIEELAAIQKYRERVQHVQISSAFDNGVNTWLNKFTATFLEHHLEATTPVKNLGPLVFAVTSLGHPNVGWSEDQLREYAQKLQTLSDALRYQSDTSAEAVRRQAQADMENLRQELISKRQAAMALSADVKRVNELKKQCEELARAHLQNDSEKNCRNRLQMTLESAIQNAMSQGDESSSVALRAEYRQFILGN